MNYLFHLGREIYQRAGLILGFLLFGVGSLIFTLVSMTLYPLLPRNAGTRLGRSSITWYFRGYLALLKATGIMRLDLRALDPLRGERGLLIAPNHPCLLDAVLVLSRLPDMTCIMKAEIWDSAFLGGGARLARYIRNDSPGNMIRHAIAELRDGQQLLVFPEGTRTRSQPINAFKGGFALIARNSGVPIQTVFIETNSAFLGKGWPLWKKPPMPIVFRARLGRRFHVHGDVKAFVRELEDYFRSELGKQASDGHAQFASARESGSPRHAP
jgi:1-acyl-sn-glycerol-3-phosphate acyltransferase